VARLKPRFHPEVNRWWLCDEGRYGFRWVDDDTRLTAPLARVDGTLVETTWDEALAALAGRLRGVPAEAVGVLASPQMANEDLWALRRLLEHLGPVHRDFRVPHREPWADDALLRRADRNPNSRGAELLGLGPAAGGLDARGILEAAAEKRVRVLWVFHHDLLLSGLPEALAARALAGAETLVFQGPTAGKTSQAAHLVLPAAAWVEREGTFTNFQGRVQRFRQALPPLGEARADWEVLGALGRALGARDPALQAQRAEQVFAALAAAVPAFAGQSYRALGDAGLTVRA
jgi:NADH-quinone oxidoreductase subunit G